DAQRFSKPDLPLRQPRAHFCGRSARSGRSEEERVAMAIKNVLSRREFVKDTGGLLIGFSLADSAVLPRILAAAVEANPAPSPNRLEAWLRIDRDGNVHVFTGKAEIGMGVETGFTQIVAEELDVPFSRVFIAMGDTSSTADQGGVGGSTSIALGSKPLRNASATARTLLVRLAAKNLGASADELQVREGVVSVKGDPSRKISYAELAASGDLDDTLKVSGEGFALNVEGLGNPKDPSSYTVVGQPIPRVDLEPKILGKWKYVTDVRVSGMLHGRVVRPAGVGAKLMGVDDSAAKKIPGYVQTVTKGNFVGVVAENEWAAI